MRLRLSRRHDGSCISVSSDPGRTDLVREAGVRAVRLHDAGHTAAIVPHLPYWTPERQRWSTNLLRDVVEFAQNQLGDRGGCVNRQMSFRRPHGCDERDPQFTEPFPVGAC